MDGGPAGAERGTRIGALAGLGLALLAPVALAAQTAAASHALTAGRHAPPAAGAPAPPAGAIPAPGELGRLEVGQIVGGELEPGDRLMADSTFADLWLFTGTAGEQVTISVRSDEFDTFLQVLDAAGRKLAEDDDSGGDLNSRLTLTLPATGEYQVVVNSAGHERRAGAYTLSIK